MRVRTENEAIELIRQCRAIIGHHPEKEKIELQIKELKERFNIEPK